MSSVAAAGATLSPSARLMSPRVVTSSAVERAASGGFARPASRALLAAGLIYLIGSLVDLGILWIGQRQPGLQWEFVALTNTVEAWPRLVLALGLLYAALHVGGSRSVAAFRFLGAGLLVLGLAALALGGGMALNYLQVRGNLQPESAGLIKMAVLKTGVLCLLYVVLLIPLGIAGLRGLGSDARGS